ncbi:MAG: hypothetical protein ABIL09_09350 [Gemmatimonadota bacterium]
MHVILAFDTEDVYYPPEYGIDDIPGWLAQIMTAAGITGTFFVMGEKAESLRRRGRRDVLERLKAHDLASHQQGNRYPLLPQVVEGLGWADGVAAVGRYEDWVTEQHWLAFGREPVGLSRHNCYFAAQHVGLGGERGLPYMYMIQQLPGSTQPLWYAGALTFPSDDTNTYAGFDRIYSRDDLFDRHFAGLQTFVDACLERGQEWIIVFGCHPVQVMAREWLEHHALGSGKARTPQDLGWHYRVKPREEEARAQANFRKLCAYLAGHGDLEVVGMSEAARRYAAQPERLGRDALTGYARQLTSESRIGFHAAFSPAELVCGLAAGLAAAGDGGDLPEEVERPAALGPMARPAIAAAGASVSRAELLAACRELVAAVKETGHLPANLVAGPAELGIGQVALLAARAYLAEARYDRYERLAVTAAPRYPEIAYQLDAWIRRHIGDHWALPLDFSCETMAEQARLQTWSMKPAWQRPPQGPVEGRPFAGRTPVSG